MDWDNIAAWFTGGTRDRELSDMRSQWAEVDALWQHSSLGTTPLDDLTVLVMKRVFKACDRLPAYPVIAACAEAVERILRAEDVLALVADWPVIDGDVAAAVEVRKLLVRRRRWAADFERMFAALGDRLADGFVELFRVLPESCFQSWDTDRGEALGVPLIELLDRPAEMVERFLVLPSTYETERLDLFYKLRRQLIRNTVMASGFAAETPPEDVWAKLLMPTRLKGRAPSELVTEYLEFTPFMELFELPVPFHVPPEMRFEHCHIIGGTGHGKTQLMQRMIHDDLMAAVEDGRSVVVIDSQGDMINKLIRLELFSPDVPGSLADRLVLIDPSDIEYPAALNLFDAHLDRTEGYSPVDRERVLNGVVALYETFFGEMLGAELTQKQGVVFRYLARLMITIPGANIQTLMQIMEDGAAFRPHMARLQGSAKHFFETEFFAPSFTATKKQILRRLWGVLSTPAFERMFVQPENKLDLYAAMNEGKIILVSTAKDLLKADGSALLGRFFISMIAQAALERSVIPIEKRTPTFVYVDEAQEYFGDDVETILSQARKYRVGLTLAHQTLDQLSPRLRSALHSNTSFKCAGGVSSHDARALAQELHTTAEFVEGMRRRPAKTEFAAWLKGITPSAIRLSVTLGSLERQPTLTEDGYDCLVRQNQKRYAGTPFELPPPTKIALLPTSPLTTPPSESDSVFHVEPHSAPDAPPSSLIAGRLNTSPPRGSIQGHGLGKGGRKHRYLQALVKELGEQHGFRGTVEAPTERGQVDVLLERQGMRVAFEISVTTPTQQERSNVRKCLEAGFDRVALVMVKSRASQARLKASILGGLNKEEAARVVCLTPEELPDYIAGFALPRPSETLVKGYRVVVTRAATTTDDARSRRKEIARVVARSSGRSIE